MILVKQEACVLELYMISVPEQIHGTRCIPSTGSGGSHKQTRILPDNQRLRCQGRVLANGSGPKLTMALGIRHPPWAMAMDQDTLWSKKQRGHFPSGNSTCIETNTGHMCKLR